MKLKGKLYISFGSVMIVSLIILGIIIHYSFSENTIRSGEEILRLKTENLSAQIELKLRNHTDDIHYSLLPYLQNGNIVDSSNSDITKKIEFIKKTDQLINGIYIANRINRKIIAQTTDSEQLNYQELPKKLTRGNNSFTLATTNDKLYISWIPFPKEENIVAAIELNRQLFLASVDSLFEISQSIIFLIDNNEQMLLTLDHSEGLLHQKFDTKFAENCAHGINQAKENDGYLYRHQNLFFGNHAYLLMDKDYFFKELTSLRNRIATGVLIVCWLLIWVIMIFAHKLSSPITKLSQITHDIIVLNYDTELKTPKTKDEIGELYQNFETMRRKLKDLITKDPLTHIYNRRFLMHIFEITVLKALRLEQNLSCIMLDIDFFKEINDQNGHQCGDTVLSEIGRLILRSCRPYDTPARYGGEEFMIILPETAATQAYGIAERLRHSISELKIPCENDKTIGCTVSIGVAEFDLHDANTPEVIINNADFALYHAKKKGRNQTSVFERGMAICHDCSSEKSKIKH